MKDKILKLKIRVAVDEILRVELNNLKMAVEGKKKKGGKPAKKKKPKKARKNKDPTADRSIESLYGELVSKQIIQKVRKPLNSCH